MPQESDTLFDSDAMILCVAPNGARRMKRDHPALPLTVTELRQTALDCRRHQASMLHLHVREADGTHSLDPTLYRIAIDAIRSTLHDDLVIQISTESLGRYDRFAQSTILRTVVPEAVSLSVREFVPNEAAIDDFRYLLEWCMEHDVFVQYILYDTTDVRWFTTLYHQGVIPEKRPFGLFVFGRYDVPAVWCASRLCDFMTRWKEVSDMAPWCVCAFGGHEIRCLLFSAGLGGHVRVGFENNLWLPEGRLAESNAELVSVVASGVQGMGRRLATPEDIRRLRDTWRNG